MGAKPHCRRCKALGEQLEDDEGYLTNTVQEGHSSCTVWCHHQGSRVTKIQGEADIGEIRGYAQMRDLRKCG